MTTARRRRQCCLVGAAIFSAWGNGRCSSSASAFGFGGLSQQSGNRSLRWVGAGGRSEASTPRPGAARIRSRTPSPPTDREALSATSRRRSAFVVDGGVGPAAASTTQDWRDLSIEVRCGFVVRSRGCISSPRLYAAIAGSGVHNREVRVRQCLIACKFARRPHLLVTPQYVFRVRFAVRRLADAGSSVESSPRSTLRTRIF